MDSVYIGLIIPWSGTYAPLNWLFCQGQTLSITQYQALYSLIGIRFGGDGKTNFQLPNLQQQIIIGAGGVNVVGMQGGSETATLNINNIPSHNHAFMASSKGGTQTAPAGNYLAATSGVDRDYRASGTLTPFANNALVSAGTNTPAAFSIRQPSLTLNFIICTDGGNYPVRP